MITAGEAAAAVRGRLEGDAGASLMHFSIDSRSLRPGALFFAIRGDRFDGHDFVHAAVAAGASGVVVSRPIEAAVRFSILVRDTTEALQDLARHVRRVSGSKVVAVTGSAGKTTTKEAAAAFLSAKFKVFRNAGNLNNHIGLPLSLLELVHRPDVAVVELGMNHAGELRKLSGIAEPDVRVWTNVAEVHTEFFESLEAVADAKAEILEGAGPGSLLIANYDDPRVMARVGAFPGRTVTFGFDNKATVHAAGVENLGLEGTSGTLVTPSGQAAFHSPLVGRVNVANVVAAAATAWSLGVEPAEIASRIRSIRAAAHRGVVVALRDGIKLVDDSYNSNPRALLAMLRFVSEIEAPRRVGVLGEMLELGGTSIAWHEECGREAAHALQTLIAVGGRPAQALARAAAERMPAGTVSWVPASDEAAERLLQLVKPGDVVLVKGSRGIRTEVVVEKLMKERGTAAGPEGTPLG
ncbi:MAG: UDP-N-acetylmuramoyl-tripeptide--D-alanyl-D-alanine ligase [Vicinamibacterales bacterium]